MDTRIELEGETLVLLPERAVFRERSRTLLIADAHFGKASAFRAGGVPVPRGTTLGALTRLDALVERTHARRIIFLGDFLHARAGRTPGTLGHLLAWRLRHRDVAMTLVRGNHDRAAGDPPDELDIGCVEEPLLEPPFTLAHYPSPSDVGYTLAGHLHPGARLVGTGRQRLRLPCFWFGARVAVLPAFGEFTGLAPVEPAAGDRVFVVADTAVIPVTKT
jgi:uncharacterized protein